MSHWKAVPVSADDDGAVMYAIREGAWWKFWQRKRTVAVVYPYNYSKETAELIASINRPWWKFWQGQLAFGKVWTIEEMPDTKGMFYGINEGNRTIAAVYPGPAARETAELIVRSVK